MVEADREDDEKVRADDERVQHVDEDSTASEFCS
jgi:hypothetical protein